jgi:hypothetical protein
LFAVISQFPIEQGLTRLMRPAKLAGDCALQQEKQAPHNVAGMAAVNCRLVPVEIIVTAVMRR